MIKKELESLKNEKKADHLAYFFKTGKGEYGEGDLFLGITVPEQRRIAKNNLEVSFKELQELLDSKYHECRLTALLVLVENYHKDKERVVEFYLKNIKSINNWDLVDLSCPKILGAYLFQKERNLLSNLAKSKYVGAGIAIVSLIILSKQ